MLRGAVDSLFQDRESGKLIVLDFKTRGYPLRDNSHTYYQDQMDLYNLFLRKNDYETEDFSLLVFYHPLSVHEGGEVRFQADVVKLDVNIKAAEDLFKRAIEVLKGDMPEPSKDCGFCNWERVK